MIDINIECKPFIRNFEGARIWTSYVLGGLRPFNHESDLMMSVWEVPGWIEAATPDYSSDHRRWESVRQAATQLELARIHDRLY